MSVAEVRSLSEEEVRTIYDRPFGLRFIGLTQMSFGFFGLIAAAGVLMAFLLGEPSLRETGLLYSAVIFVGVALPCMVIGNYVDDLRRNAVYAQILYSLIAVILTAFFLYNWGLDYGWGIPLFGPTFEIAIGRVAAFVLVVQTIFLLYLVIRWKDVAPPKGIVVIRDRDEARILASVVYPTPLETTILGPDGISPVTPEEEQRIIDVRRVVTEEGMAILCSNCDGATPLAKVEKNNTLRCDYCGVTLAVSSVFVPCEDHPEYLAATTCAVCGEHYCRRCLTAQDPPVDERWQASTVFLCRKCFEGRYRPAVTTASLVLPIEDLFGQAGGRFSRVSSIYRRFVGAYGRALGWVFRGALEFAGAFLKAGGGGGGGGGGSGDGCIGAILLIIIIIIAIPFLVGVLMLLGAIVIIPILFYAGLVGVTVEAIRIISKTDFISVEVAREKGLLKKKEVKVKPSPIREEVRPWMSQKRAEEYAQDYEHDRRLRETKRKATDVYWRKT